LWVLGAYILVAPVVEPWYFTWLAPLIALQLLIPGARAGSLAAAAWVWLMGTSILTDLTYLPGGSTLWPVIRAIEYVPAFALLAASGLLLWRRRRVNEKPGRKAPAFPVFVGERS
jgi:MYXO-CTERM domain-containing protein